MTVEPDGKDWTWVLDRRCPECGYDASRVAATDVATRFDTVVGESWQRTGRRSDGASFTVDTFARYFLHDIVHHLHDVGA